MLKLPFLSLLYIYIGKIKLYQDKVAGVSLLDWKRVHSVVD